MEYIEFTKEKGKELKKAWQKAVKEGKTLFTYDGNKYVSDYAKYLIEFLETKFGKL